MIFGQVCDKHVHSPIVDFYVVFWWNLNLYQSECELSNDITWFSNIVHRRISHGKTDQYVKYKYLLISNCIDMHKFKISQRNEIIIFHFLKTNCVYDYFFLLVYYYISGFSDQSRNIQYLVII